MATQKILSTVALLAASAAALRVPTPAPPAQRPTITAASPVAVESHPAASAALLGALTLFAATEPVRRAALRAAAPRRGRTPPPFPI